MRKGISPKIGILCVRVKIIIIIIMYIYHALVNVIIIIRLAFCSVFVFGFYHQYFAFENTVTNFIHVLFRSLYTSKLVRLKTKESAVVSARHAVGNHQATCVTFLFKLQTDSNQYSWQSCSDF